MFDMEAAAAYKKPELNNVPANQVYQLMKSAGFAWTSDHIPQYGSEIPTYKHLDTKEILFYHMGKLWTPGELYLELKENWTPSCDEATTWKMYEMKNWFLGNEEEAWIQHCQDFADATGA